MMTDQDVTIIQHSEERQHKEQIESDALQG